jgi:hypothetical protein
MEKFLTSALLGGSFYVSSHQSPNQNFENLKRPVLHGLNLCAFASLREIFCSWFVASQRYVSLVSNSFQYTNHFDLSGLREHVEGLNFLNPEALGEPLEIAGEGRGVARHID